MFLLLCGWFFLTCFNNPEIVQHYLKKKKNIKRSNYWCLFKTNWEDCKLTYKIYSRPLYTAHCRTLMHPGAQVCICWWCEYGFWCKLPSTAESLEILLASAFCKYTWQASDRTVVFSVHKWTSLRLHSDIACFSVKHFFRIEGMWTMSTAAWQHQMWIVKYHRCRGNPSSCESRNFVRVWGIKLKNFSQNNIKIFF